MTDRNIPGKEPLTEPRQIELERQNRELREAQQQLEELRDHYVELYDFAPVGYLTLDEHGRVLEANLAAAALLGHKRANLIGKSFVSWLEQGEGEKLFDHLGIAFSAPPNATAELKIMKAGEIRDLRLESAAICTTSEHYRNCRTVMIDITEQKRMADRLQQSLTEWEALLNAIPAAVYFKDTELRYTSMNPFCAELMHKPIAEMLGKTAVDLFPREIAENLQLADRVLLQSGEAVTGLEQQLVDARGDPFWVSMSKTPCFGPNGKVTGLVGTIMDITPIRQARQRAHELLQENRRLTRRLFDVQEKERRHLARELHDELGQWLTAIQAEAQAMYTMNCLKEKPPCRESAQAIVNSAALLHQVVRRILRRLRPTLLEQLGLADSLRELISQWQGSHPGINCDITLDGALDDLDKRLEITLYRVVQEGLNNISTHSDASRVSIAVHRTPEAVMLSLQDNGMGMSDIPSFRQGMGLLGMRERVIAAEGKFTLRSTPGQGLCIDIMLPLTQPEDHNENFGFEDH